MSNSVRPHRRQPTRLLCPWDSPGKNTGVGCHFLLQGMKVKSESEVAQSNPTLATPSTAAYQAPPSMGFSRQEYWRGVPLPSPGNHKRITKYLELRSNENTTYQSHSVLQAKTGHQRKCVGFMNYQRNKCGLDWELYLSAHHPSFL